VIAPFADDELTMKDIATTREDNETASQIERYIEARSSLQINMS